MRILVRRHLNPRKKNLFQVHKKVNTSNSEAVLQLFHTCVIFYFLVMLWLDIGTLLFFCYGYVKQ